MEGLLGFLRERRRGGGRNNMSGRFLRFSCRRFFLDSLDFSRLRSLGVEIVLKFQKEILSIEELIKELV